MTERLNGCRVLLVEDEMMVSILIEDMLKSLGCTVAACAGRVEDALPLASAAAIDVAVLDVNLGALDSSSVADALAARGIPFVFVTGYSSGCARNASHSGSPRLRKPFETRQLAEVLTAALEHPCGKQPPL